jgi:hypothetical protein
MPENKKNIDKFSSLSFSSHTWHPCLETLSGNATVTMPTPAAMKIWEIHGLLVNI